LATYVRRTRFGNGAPALAALRSSASCKTAWLAYADIMRRWLCRWPPHTRSAHAARGLLRLLLHLRCWPRHALALRRSALAAVARMQTYRLLLYRHSLSNIIAASAPFPARRLRSDACAITTFRLFFFACLCACCADKTHACALRSAIVQRRGHALYASFRAVVPAVWRWPLPWLAVQRCRQRVHNSAHIVLRLLPASSAFAVPRADLTTGNKRCLTPALRWRRDGTGKMAKCRESKNVKEGIEWAVRHRRREQAASGERVSAGGGKMAAAAHNARATSLAT